MIRILLPLLCAALGLAAASCGQADGPFGPAAAPDSPGATLHGAAAAAMPSPPDSSQAPARPETAPPAASPPATTDSPPAPQEAPAADGAPQRASTLIGMPVVSADGSPLGQVKDIVFDREGRATHVVIGYDAPPHARPPQIPDTDAGADAAPDGRLTAMPWDTAVASIANDRIVLDGAKLQGAPSFTPQGWPNLSDPAWSLTSDAYWRKVARSRLAAHPRTPVDSTARLRSRPNRNGN